MVSDEFYIVEFNWKHVGFHTEPLRSRLRKNVSELLDKGKPGNPDWVTIGIAENCQEAQKYIEAFQAEWKKHAVARERGKRGATRPYHDREWLTEARLTRTLQDIGDEFGVTRQNISLWCKKFNILPRQVPVVPAPFETFLDYVKDRRSRGWSKTRIYAESGHSCHIVDPYIREANVDTQVVRFHLQVDTTGDGCWPWQGCRHPYGYGRLHWKEQGTLYAHRVAWELAYGPIPEGKQVLHKCDSPPCCRPDHLFLGTAADNIHDRDMKGRGIAGLMPRNIRDIRTRCAAGESPKTIAQAHGIHESTVRNIHSRKTWDWLETDHTIRGAWGL